MNNQFMLVLGILVIIIYSVALVPNCVDIPVSELSDEEPDTTFNKEDVIDIFSKLEKGYVVISTIGNSMLGVINPNQRCICTVEDNYREGDIVLFLSGSQGVAHEIVYLTETGFITKGTNNDLADGEVHESQVMCSIEKIPRYKLW